MDHDSATNLIWQAWQGGFDYPESLTDWLTYERALRVQSALLARRLENGETHAGWKIGLTSERVREKLGTSDQPFGHIMRVLPSDSRISLNSIATDTSIEPELIITLRSELAGPGVDAAAARSACGTLAAGFEVNQNRVPLMQSFPLLVADNLTQWAIVSGEPVPLTEQFESDRLRVSMQRNGEIIDDVVGTTDVIDDHFRSVAVLANTLARYGHRLKAGQRLITGSFCRQAVTPGESWSADFHGIGQVRLTIDN